MRTKESYTNVFGRGYVEQDFQAPYDVVEDAVISVEGEKKRRTLSVFTDGLDHMKNVEEMGETFAEMVSEEVSIFIAYGILLEREEKYS